MERAAVLPAAGVGAARWRWASCRRLGQKLQRAAVGATCRVWRCCEGAYGSTTSRRRGATRRSRPLSERRGRWDAALAVVVRHERSSTRPRWGRPARGFAFAFLFPFCVCVQGQESWTWVMGYVFSTKVGGSGEVNLRRIISDVQQKLESPFSSGTGLETKISFV